MILTYVTTSFPNAATITSYKQMNTEEGSAESIKVYVYPFLRIHEMNTSSGSHLNSSSSRSVKSRLRWYVRSHDEEAKNAVLSLLSKYTIPINRGLLAPLAEMARSQPDPEDWKLALSIYRSLFVDALPLRYKER